MDKFSELRNEYEYTVRSIEKYNQRKDRADKIADKLEGSEEISQNAIPLLLLGGLLGWAGGSFYKNFAEPSALTNIVVYLSGILTTLDLAGIVKLIADPLVGDYAKIVSQELEEKINIAQEDLQDIKEELATKSR